MMFYSLTLTCVSILYFYIYTHTHTKPCAICIPRDTEMQRSGVRIKHFQNLLYWVFLFAQVSCDTLFYNLLHRKIFSNSVFCGMVKIHLLFFIKMSFDCCALGKKNHKGTKNRTQIQDCCLRTRNPRFWAMVGVDLVAFVKSP